MSMKKLYPTKKKRDKRPLIHPKFIELYLAFHAEGKNIDKIDTLNQGPLADMDPALDNFPFLVWPNYVVDIF